MSGSAVLCGVADVSKFFCHCGSGPPGLSVFWGDLGLLSWLSEVLFPSPCYRCLLEFSLDSGWGTLHSGRSHNLFED